jgi:hypothetical protein
METKSVQAQLAPNPPARRRNGRTPVIADGGDVAFLAFTPSMPSVGMRFSLHGQLWEITRPRTPARTFVAEPVHH